MSETTLPRIQQSSEKSPLRENATPMHTDTNEEHHKDLHYEELKQSASSDGFNDNESSGLTVKEAARWRLSAIIISWISIVIIIILGAISFGASMKTHSAAAYGFGFDCILDLCTSCIVLWRFYGSVGTLYSAERERISLTFLGLVFTLASISIIVRAIINLVSETHTVPHYSLYVLAASSGVLCFVLAIIKFIIANKLDSRSLRTDAYSSLAGSILGFSILLSTQIIKRNKDIWYFDEAIAIFVGIFLGIYGARLLVDVMLETSCQTQIVGLCCCCERQSESSNVI